MIPKSWRIGVWNWLGAGKVKLTVDKPQEYTMGNTYTFDRELGKIITVSKLRS